MKKSKLLKILVPSIIAIAMFTAPILHQNLPNNYTSHFSILQAIQTDISEKQIQTPYFIAHIF